MLEAIKKTFDKNDLFLRVVATYLNKYERLVTKEIMEEITGGNSELDATAFSAFLSSAFIDDHALERELEREYFTPSVKKLDPKEYKVNPYYKSIKIPEKKIGGWTLGWQKYAPYEGFIRDDYTVYPDNREVPSIGFFDEEFSFPTVYENGVEWMAIKPNEIETMREPVKKARGRVVAFGLGLGYFAYMASLKNEVSSITVVERDESVIELFESEILPQFENKDKISIVKADAFNFVCDKSNSGKFDYAFVDLWRDTSDGTDLYIKMKKLENKLGCPFEYWIEKSILLGVRKNLFYAIYESVKSGKNTLSYKEICDRLSLDYIKEFVKFI
ncbi:MAG: hypothetical protein IJW19_07135 [Clostridia bacterium]|nr:hypothetical protein [Clostridia bacterium]